MIEINRHKGGCCWFLDRTDGKYRCAIKGCNKEMEQKPD